MQLTQKHQNEIRIHHVVNMLNEWRGFCHPFGIGATEFAGFID